MVDLFGAATVADVWHGDLVGAHRIVPEERRKASRWLNTFRLCRASWRYDRIVTSQGSRSVYGLAFLGLFLRMTRQRKLVLVEFLPGQRLGAKGRLATWLYRHTLPYACSGIQVMTEWERADYVDRYALPVAMVRCIPFYYYDDRVRSEPADVERFTGKPKLFSSGRNACDWDVLLDAAEGQDWDLTVVVSQVSVEHLSKREIPATVRVLSEIGREEHDKLLAGADLFILALVPASRSAGHVRLQTCATHAVPVVASRVKGIEGYEQLACLVAPPQDAVALRLAINAALVDPEALAIRERRVTDAARARPYSIYTRDISEFIRSS